MLEEGRSLFLSRIVLKLLTWLDVGSASCRVPYDVWESSFFSRILTKSLDDSDDDEEMEDEDDDDEDD